MGEVSNHVLWLHTVCGYCMYCVLNERLCISLFVSLCILLFSSDLGQSIFYTTTCLLPFLSDDILSTLPYTMISTLATFPPFLHKDIIEYLSTSFLPMAIREYPPYHLTKQVFQALSTTLFTNQRHNLIHLNHTEIKPVTFFLSLSSLFLLVCSGLDPEGRRGPSLCQFVCFLYAYDCHAVHLKPR